MKSSIIPFATLATWPCLWLLMTSMPLFAQSGSGTWTRQAFIRLNNFSISLSAIAAADTTNLIASGAQDINDLIFRSTDGGATWNLMHVDTATEYDYSDLAHPTPSLCIAVGNRGHIIRSSDGGSSWNTIPCDAKAATTDSMSLTQIAMCDSLHGIVAGFTQVFLRTVDGGITWKRIPSPVGIDSTSLGFPDLACLTPHTYVALLGGKVGGVHKDVFYRSDDSGEHWWFTDIPTLSNLIRISFPDTIHGWIAGYGKTDQSGKIQNIILRTIDGGHTWDTVLEEIVSGESAITSIKFSDPLHGIAVMCGDRTFRTTDGGSTWSVYTKLVQNNALLVVTDLVYPDSTKAWTVSSTGKVMLFSTRNTSSVPQTDGRAASAMLYPNPLIGPSPIHLSLQLLKPSRIHITLIDNRGDEVAVMMDAALEQGVHTITLERLRGLASGAYFMRLAIDGKVETIPFAVVD